MITLPSFVKPDQTSRVILHVDQATSNPHEHLETLAAHALARARWALEQLRGMQPGAFLHARRSWELLNRAVRDRDALSDSFREAAAEFADFLDRLEVTPDFRPAASGAARALKEAVELSHKVADLVAAEQTIGKLRGLGD